MKVKEESKNVGLKLNIQKTVLYICVSLDSVGAGEGGMILENGIETCIISYMKCIASPGSMVGAGALGRPRGKVWRGRREGGSVRGTHTCIPVVDFC